jgi:Zn-finger in ubiquitin-hydrolases and other protein
MQATCPHLDQIAEVGPGADVCEICVTMGATWLNLRQCRICGFTGCCDSSPHKHATAHFHETGHPIMRSVEPGHDWSWCFLCRETLREDGAGGFEVSDSFFDAGLYYARQMLADGRPIPFPPDATVDGFPLGVWEATYRGRHRAGSLDPDQAAALEALDGWRW